MKTRITTAFGMFFFVIALSLSAYAYEVTTEVSSESIPMNAELVLTVTVSWPQNDDVDQMVRTITPPESEFFELMHATQSSRSVYHEDGPMEHKYFHYRYRPRLEGEITFDAFTVELVHGDDSVELITGDPVVVTVLPLWHFYGMWLVYAVCALMVSVACVCVWRALVKRRQEKKRLAALASDADAELKRLKELRDTVVSLKQHSLSGDEDHYLKKVLACIAACPASAERDDVAAAVAHALEDVAYAGVRFDEAARSIVMRKIERFFNMLVKEEEI